MRTSEPSVTTGGRRDQRRRTGVVRGAAAAVGLTLALLTGACGGGSEEGSSGTGNGQGSSASSNNDPQKAFLAYARCMREQGINMPDPDPSNGVVFNAADRSIDRDALAKAESQCKKHLEGVTVDNADGDDAEMQDRMVKLTQCLRQRGFNIPDPQPVDSGGAPSQAEPDFDLNDPNFKKAERECAKVAGLPEPERTERGGRR